MQKVTSWFYQQLPVLADWSFVDWAVSKKVKFCYRRLMVHGCCHLFYDSLFQVRTKPVVCCRILQLGTSKKSICRSIITKVVFRTHCPGTCVPSATYRCTIMMKHLMFVLPPCHLTVYAAMPSNIHVFYPFATVQPRKIYRIEICNLCADVISIHNPICLEATGYSPVWWTRPQLLHFGEGQPKQTPVWIIFIRRFVDI